MHHAEQEGVEFHWLTDPVEMLDDGKGGVRGMRCVRMELGEPDDSGRRRPVPVAGSEFELECDQVVFAIGTNANPIIGQTSQLKLNKRGYIATDDNLATSMAGVFAGGDIVTGAATVIEAMGAGRKAARSMKAYLGIRDSSDDAVGESAGTFFGIDLREHNFARIAAPRKVAQSTDTADIAVKPCPRASKAASPDAERQGGRHVERAHRRDHQRFRRRRAALRPVPRRDRRADGQRRLDRWRSSRPKSARRRAASPAPAATASASARGPVTNGGDETDLVVAFNEQVLLGRVRAGELKPDCTILLESMWREAKPTRRSSTSYIETYEQLVAAGYHVVEMPMERECQDHRRRRAARQEHVRARHAVQHLQPRPEARARTDRAHLRQEGRQRRRGQRQAA